MDAIVQRQNGKEPGAGETIRSRGTGGSLKWSTQNIRRSDQRSWGGRAAILRSSNKNTEAQFGRTEDRQRGKQGKGI